MVRIIKSTGDSSNHDALREFYRQQCKDPQRPFRRVDSFLLPMAVENGHGRIIPFLLDKGLNPEYETWTGRTVLYHAAKKGDEATVRLLLERGANPNPEERWDGCTVLPVAAEYGHLRIVTILLDHGVDPDVPTLNHETPMYKAVEGGHEQIVELLRQRGADFHYVCGDWGETRESPLTIAAKKEYTNIVQLFLKHELEFGSLPLSRAAEDDSSAGMIPQLIALGFNPNIQDCDGNSPLVVAAERKSRACFDLLIQHMSPESRIRHGNAAFTEINSITGDINEYDEEWLHYVVDTCVDVQHKHPEWGSTFLTTAVEFEKPRMVKFLLDKGADPNTPDEDGDTPLSIARWKENEEIVKILLDHGAVERDIEILRGRRSSESISPEDNDIHN